MYFWKLINEARSLQKTGDKQALFSVLFDIEKHINTLNDDARIERLAFFNKFLNIYKINFDNSVVAKLASCKPAKVNAATNISLDSHVQAVGSGVSLVSCCMNRTENLVKALPSWISFKEINEIIIVDWSSTEPVKEHLIQYGFTDSRIKVIRVDGQLRWILSYAFNVGFRAASYDKILKTDADIIIYQDFFAKNILNENLFISGDWRIAEKGQEHINGFFYVSRNKLMRIKGFNEYITTYGWDDDDIYNRLEGSGVQRARVDTSTIYHIPHDDSLRVGGVSYGSDYLKDFHLTTDFKIRNNRFIANVMPLWNKDRVFLPFKIVDNKPGFLRLEQSGETIHYVPAHIRDDAEIGRAHV